MNAEEIVMTYSRVFLGEQNRIRGFDDSTSIKRYLEGDTYRIAQDESNATKEDKAGCSCVEAAPKVGAEELCTTEHKGVRF